MSDEAALLRAIQADPEADLPRLIYADWLEENGQPERAEFVRVQCELAGLDEDDYRARGLAWRAAALERDHGRRWKSAVPKWAKKFVRFRRGLPTHVDFGPQTDLLKRLPELRQALWIDGLSVTQLNDNSAVPAGGLTRLRLATGYRKEIDGWLSRLVKAGGLDSVRELSVGNYLERHDLTALLKADLGRLESLEVDHNPDVRPAQIFAGPGGASRLTRLRVRWLGPGDLDRLFDSGLAGRLTDLSSTLEFNGFSFLRPPAVIRLAASPRAADLRRVGTVSVDGDALNALVSSPHLGNLEVINVEASAWGQGSPLKAMVEAEAFPRLTRLRLEPPQGDTFRHLVKSRHWTRLRQLHLGNSGLGDADVAALAGWPGLSGVRHLGLGGNPKVSAAGIRALAGSPAAAGLECLNLTGCLIGDGGVQALARSPHLTGLRELLLGTNQISPAGFTELAASPNLAGVHLLMLTNNIAGPAGTDALIESPYLGGLRRLDLAACDIDGKGRFRLRGRFGTDLVFSGNVPEVPRRY